MSPSPKTLSSSPAPVRIDTHAPASRTLPEVGVSNPSNLAASPPPTLSPRSLQKLKALEGQKAWRGYESPFDSRIPSLPLMGEEAAEGGDAPLESVAESDRLVPAAHDALHAGPSDAGTHLDGLEGGGNTSTGAGGEKEQGEGAGAEEQRLASTTPSEIGVCVPADPPGHVPADRPPSTPARDDAGDGADRGGGQNGGAQDRLLAQDRGWGAQDLFAADRWMPPPEQPHSEWTRWEAAGDVWATQRTSGNSVGSSGGEGGAGREDAREGMVGDGSSSQGEKNLGSPKGEISLASPRELEQGGGAAAEKQRLASELAQGEEGKEVASLMEQVAILKAQQGEGAAAEKQILAIELAQVHA
ncbi:hypothetical protein T484DRAFT_1768717 [Baffinella frigidus]|nr:hypothetical protein T484DRAFT_1768717 [Cryptophyta sp. CCMP2293]